MAELQTFGRMHGTKIEAVLGLLTQFTGVVVQPVDQGTTAKLAVAQFSSHLLKGRLEKTLPLGFHQLIATRQTLPCVSRAQSTFDFSHIVDCSHKTALPSNG